jgi:hypothetical protein
MWWNLAWYIAGRRIYLLHHSSEFEGIEQNSLHIQQSCSTFDISCLITAKTKLLFSKKCTVTFMSILIYCSGLMEVHKFSNIVTIFVNKFCYHNYTKERVLFNMNIMPHYWEACSYNAEQFSVIGFDITDLIIILENSYPTQLPIKFHVPVVEKCCHRGLLYHGDGGRTSL